MLRPPPIGNPLNDSSEWRLLDPDRRFSMHDAFSPTTLLRNIRPLRGILIGDQPWFVAADLARLLGLNYPRSLARRLEPHERRAVRLRHADAGEEPVEGMSEAVRYKAPFRFGHPENRTLGRWLAESVIPLLRDQGRGTAQRPRRLLMSWHSQRVTVLDWQGELWVPLQQLPTFSPFVAGAGSWLGRLRGSAAGERGL